MKTFKQHFSSVLAEMTRPGLARYFKTSARTGETKFKSRQYEDDTNDLLRRAQRTVSKLDQGDKESIRSEIAELLFKIDMMYDASGDERTDAKGDLARKRTEIIKRARQMNAMPTYGEAVQFAKDLKIILRG